MPRRFSTIVLAFVTIAITLGCGGKDAEPVRYNYDYSSGKIEFKDDAPSNSPRPSDFPVAFVDAEGKSINLTAYRGKQKVVLVVLRGITRSEKGGICPSCVTQTGSLIAHKEEFASRGAEVLVVFPGPAERLEEFLTRARAESATGSSSGFQMLLDRECTACDRLGIRDDLAKPSTYILDKRGAVVYAYVGQTSTDRPSVKAMLSQLDQID